MKVQFKKHSVIVPLFVSIIVGLSIFYLPLNYLLHFSLDDAYFYLRVADNIASGYGSTFDQINLTNGYHPLWTIVLSALFFIIKLF